MSKEAMKLALDAMNQVALSEVFRIETIKALKEALASEQEQGEPVALKVYRGELCYKSQADDQSFGMWCPVTKDLPFPEGTKFYTTPQPKQEQGEPVAITITGKLGNIYSFTGDYSLKKGDKVYTTPQQRTWVGLTDRDIEAVWGEDVSLMYSGHYDAIREIEARLKQKNAK